MSWLDVKVGGDFNSLFGGWFSIHETNLNMFRSGWSDVQGSGQGIGFPWAVVQGGSLTGSFASSWGNSTGSMNLSNGWGQVQAREFAAGRGIPQSGWSSIIAAAGASRGGWMDIQQPQINEIEFLGKMVMSGARKVGSYSKKGYEIARGAIGGVMKKVTDFKKKTTLTEFGESFKNIAAKREELERRIEAAPGKKPHLTVIEGKKKREPEPSHKKEPSFFQKETKVDELGNKFHNIKLDMEKLDLTQDLSEQVPSGDIEKVREAIYSYDQTMKEKHGEKYVSPIPKEFMKDPKEKKYANKIMEDGFFMPDPPPEPEYEERTFTSHDERPVTPKKDRELGR